MGGGGGGITNYQKINVWRWRAGGKERGTDRRGQAVGGMKIGTRNSEGRGGSGGSQSASISGGGSGGGYQLLLPGEELHHGVTQELQPLVVIDPAESGEGR